LIFLLDSFNTHNFFSFSFCYIFRLKIIVEFITISLCVVISINHDDDKSHQSKANHEEHASNKRRSSETTTGSIFASMCQQTACIFGISSITRCSSFTPAASTCLVTKCAICQSVTNRCTLNHLIVSRTLTSCLTTTCVILKTPCTSPLSITLFTINRHVAIWTTSNCFIACCG
jgi:hypothetical protein